MNVSLEGATALAVGLLTGDDSGLPPESRSLFKEAGIQHLTAASGANLALVGWAALPLQRQSRWWGEALLLALYLGYWLFTGGSGSLWRATVWAFFSVLGRCLGRAVPASYGLIFVIIVSSLSLTSYFRSIGFWLSLAASGGLIFSRKILSGENKSLLLPHWRRHIFLLFQTVFTGVVVSTTVGPIIWVFFGEFPTIGAFSTPLASLFVLPLQLTGLLFFGFQRYLKVFLPFIELCLLWQYQLFVDVIRLFTQIAARREFVLFSANCFLVCFAFVFRVLVRVLSRRGGETWARSLVT